MRTYKRNSSRDKQYRLVSLSQDISNDGDDFMDFADDVIQFEDDCAIEVKDVADKTHIIQQSPRKEVSIRREDAKILIDSSIPLQRLWVSTRDSHVRYKVPDMLPHEKNWAVMLFADKNTACNIEFVADQYFDSVYRIPANYSGK